MPTQFVHSDNNPQLMEKEDERLREQSRREQHKIQATQDADKTRRKKISNIPYSKSQRKSNVSANKNKCVNRDSSLIKSPKASTLEPTTIKSGGLWELLCKRDSCYELY